MDRSYRNRLLREAVKEPALLTAREKYWKLELWPYYLRRCDDIVFHDPVAGLVFSKPAPQLAGRIAEANPGANGADLMLLGHSYLGSAYRRIDEFASAETEFALAQQYRDSVSPRALAEHLRRLAYLRIFQQDPECFPIIEEAIGIHKRGNLVNRHQLGECLICRGRAFVMFDQHGKSFDDYTAALNHVSMKIDIKPWYCALHCLAVWAVDFGTDEQVQVAYANLKSAQAILGTFWGRPFAKLKMRWLIAIMEARRGALGRAEMVFLEVRDGLAKLRLSFEVGMLSIDLASLYLEQGRYDALGDLVHATAAIFRRIGVEAKAREAFDIWRQAEVVTVDLLKRTRAKFAEHTQPIPQGVAA